MENVLIKVEVSTIKGTWEQLRGITVEKSAITANGELVFPIDEKAYTLTFRFEKDGYFSEKWEFPVYSTDKGRNIEKRIVLVPRIKAYAEIRKNTEEFIKYFNFSLNQERVEPFKITPVQILQSPLFEKFELAGYSCEVNKMNGIVSEVSVFKQNERIADIQLMTANSSRDSIIILGNWLTDSSMQTDFLLSLYGLERNKIGEFYFYFKKFYDKQVNRYSQKNCTTFFVRHGIIVLLRNATEACPVGELAKAIDDKILKALE